MKKLFITLIVSIFALSSMYAGNNSRVNYLGEVYLGNSFGVGENPNNRTHLHTVHGIKIGNYFSTGLGTGLDLYYDGGDFMTLVPIFLNVKGYLPLNDKLAPYVSMDFGGSFGVGDSSPMSGLMFTPAVGLKIKSFNIQFAYAIQKFSIDLQDWGVLNFNCNAIQLKVGYLF